MTVSNYRSIVEDVSIDFEPLDLDVMEATSLSSYRRLVSARTFLSVNLGVTGAVYPLPPEVVADA